MHSSSPGWKPSRLASSVGLRPECGAACAAGCRAWISGLVNPRRREACSDTKYTTVQAMLQTDRPRPSQPCGLLRPPVVLCSSGGWRAV